MLALTIFGERTAYGYGSNLTAWQTLYASQNGQLVSPNGIFIFRMQSDGNLVLYHVANPGNGVPTTALWWSGTSHLPGVTVDRLVMQGDDGNLVIYSTLNVPLWYSNQPGQGSGPYTPTANARLEMQNGRKRCHLPARRTA